MQELHARTEQLDRDLRAAKEHWQAEEAVRIKWVACLACTCSAEKDVEL